MANWFFGATEVQPADAPWYESTMPEKQEAEHIEETPIGNHDTDSTIATLVNTPSIGAEGSDPFVLRGRCGASLKAVLEGFEATIATRTFTLKTPFDATGKSVYLKRLRIKRWTSQEVAAVAGAGERFHYWMFLLGR